MRRYGSLDVLLLVLRALPSVLLIAAGATKVGHFNDLAAAIAGFRILPAGVIAPIAIALPFLEIGVGLYVFCGLFTRTAALIGMLQFALYGAFIASAVLRNIPANCGCFGPSDRAVADWPHAAVDWALAALFGMIAWTGAGKISLDAVMRRT